MNIASLHDQNRYELVHTSLDLAEQSVSVFTHIYRDEALKTAAHADVMRMSRQPQSPLAGLPVSVKDLLDIAGEITMAGSVVLEGQPPAASDAAVVARLRNAGAAIIGKTNMTEFGFSGVGINPHYGTPANPLDATRITGGSSSGAAASVGAGICVAALGSDTGGSVRIPAALCGLVGFKPTMRRVPTTGALPLAPVLDSIGPIARSVADCLLVDSLIADQPLTTGTLSLSGLKFAVPEDLVMEDIDDTVARAFTHSLSKLSGAGATIVEAPMKMFSEARDINRFPQIESWRWHHKLLATHADQYDSLVATRIRAGEKYTEQDFQRLLAARKDWIARVEHAMSGFDAMLTPTVPIVAPRTEALLASEETFFEVNRLLLRNPSLINLLDGCALSIPCQRAGDLPVGLMIGAPAMADARVFSIGLAIEQALSE